MTQAIVKSLDVGSLIQQAVEHGSGVDTLERLLAMAKDVRHEQARAAWHQAMAAFQANVPEVVKSKTAKVRTRSGSEYSYMYAPLQDLITEIRPALAAHGLSVTFSTTCTKTHVHARCLVGHSDGHVETCEFVIPVDLESHMNPAQQVASACTYARRYAYMAALGLSPEDDDDAAASGDTDGRAAPSTRAAAPTPSTSPAWRGKLAKREEKVGSNNSIRYIFTGDDGTKFGTFSKTIAAALGAFMDEKMFVEIIGEPTQYGIKIVEYRSVNEEEAPFEHER